MIRQISASAAAFFCLFFPEISSAFPWSETPAADIAAPRPIASIVVSDAMPNDQSVPGVIKARLEVSLAFQTLGRLSARHVDVGDVVENDDLLAELDANDLQDQTRSAFAAVQTAGVVLETATASAERTRALARRNVATTAQLEQADQALAAADAAHLQAQSELIRAKDAESYAEMRAPFAGVISEVSATPGAVVTAGEPILQLSGRDDQEAVIDLHAAATARLSLHEPFDVWSEERPDEIWRARVSRIDPVADAATRTRRVRLDLERDDGFRLGALIRARPSRIDLRAITIPSAAIFSKGDVAHVWLVKTRSGERHVTLRQIETTGAATGGLASVASGLEVGDEIVIRGTRSLVEGQRVGKSVTP